MNKLTKVLLSILGGCDRAFSMFIPITIALLVINVVGIETAGAITVLAVALCSTIFRAIKVWV